MGIKKTIKGFACEIMGKKRLSMRKPLRQIGLESLSFAELTIAIEDFYGVELGVDDITHFYSLNALSAYVKIKVEE